jgi:N-acetyl-anhydromuramyl-L-alanine amidase AmpD
MTFSIDHTHASPNHSSRLGADIDMLVLHATAGNYASALHELCDPKPNKPDKRVSAHYLVAKNGHIDQLVDDGRAAWHAGVSSWLGRDSLEIQQHSIGIEIVNDNDGRDPYPQIQLDALTWLCTDLITRYLIPRQFVVRHLDIAPGRKTDPAGLLWPAYRDSLYTVQRYRAITCAPIFQDRKPDAVLAGSVGAGQVEAVDDITSGWVHLSSGWGFSPLSCWVPV